MITERTRGASNHGDSLQTQDVANRVHHGAPENYIQTTSRLGLCEQKCTPSSRDP